MDTIFISLPPPRFFPSFLFLCPFLIEGVQLFSVREGFKKKRRQAGVELGQAQLKLELCFTSINICRITLLIANYQPVHITVIRHTSLPSVTQNRPVYYLPAIPVPFTVS